MAATVIAGLTSLFACPICRGHLELAEGKSLVCERRHCFDLSRHGYVNLLLRPAKTKYSKSMFAARKVVISSGMFDGLHTKVSEMIAESIGGAGHGRTTILDAGCGEGSHLQAVLQTIELIGLRPGPIGVGVDLAKEAVDLAARQYPKAVWCVADLAHLPFVDRQFDVILSILSPSNYAEFRRVIAPGGVVVKVIPGERYLGELRAAWYGSADEDGSAGVSSHTDGNAEGNTEALFREQFQLLGRERLEYRFPVSAELLEPLTVMTPLSWGAMDAQQEVSQPAIREITIDLIVLVGKVKEER